MTAILEIEAGKKRRFPFYSPSPRRSLEKYGTDVFAYRLEFSGKKPSRRSIRQILSLGPDILAMDRAVSLPAPLAQLPVCRGAGLVPPLVLRRLEKEVSFQDLRIALLGVSAPFALFWIKALLESGAKLALWDWDTAKCEVLAARLYYYYGYVVESLYRTDVADRWDLTLLLSPHCPYEGTNAVGAFLPGSLVVSKKKPVSLPLAEGLLRTDGLILAEPDWGEEAMPICRVIWEGLDRWEIGEDENS